MSSRRGGYKPAGAGSSGPATKGKNVAQLSSHAVDQLNQGFLGVNLDGGNDGDGWEVYGKKSKNKPGNNSGNPRPQQNVTPNAWGNPNTAQKLGMYGGSGSGRGGSTLPAFPTEPKRPAVRGNGKLQHRNYDNPPTYTPVIPPPLKSDERIEDDDDDEDEVFDDSDDDLLSDGYDSDASQESHDTRKKCKWFKELFDDMDKLTVEQIADPERQWHCPACKGGPGAIEWFPGLRAVITHAKTKGSKRVKLHRELAKLLDEELRNRGTSNIAAGEFFGRWTAPGGVDKEIVWPPMVIIRNTQHDIDDNEKWIGMGNQELLECFSDYAASKARHSYGPQGHRGISVLIFEETAVGYLEAARLSSDFENDGMGRAGWERGGISAFYPGGKRKLFGYLAEMKDLDIFNQHSQGKSRLKFEMKSHQEMVVKQFRQMGEDNQQLSRLKNKVAEAQKRSKALEETYGIVSAKLRKTMEETRIVREKTKLHHEQNKEEMDYQERFFKEQLALILEARKDKEEHFEKIQQSERQKIKQNHEYPDLPGGNKPRADDVQDLINIQDKEMEAFVAAKENLMTSHEERKMELKRKHWEEELALEKEYDAKLVQLMGEYTPGDGNTNV